MAAWYDQITPKFVQNAAVLYLQQTKFDAFSMFPALPVGQPSGYIPKYKKEDWLRVGTVDLYKRVGATESVGDDYALDKQAYTTEPYAFHVDVTRRDREVYDNPFDPVRDATWFVVNRLRMVTTALFVSSFLATNTWGADKAGGVDFTKWSDANSDPIADVLSWKQAVLELTGFLPNRMLITFDVFAALQTNSAIRDVLKVTSDKVVTRERLANLFDLEELVVLDSVRTTAAKGETATSSNTGLFATKKALLVFAPDRPSVRMPSAGYHIVYRQAGQDIRTRSIPMPQLDEALRIEGQMELCPKVVASDLGVYAYDVI